MDCDPFNAGYLAPAIVGIYSGMTLAGMKLLRKSLFFGPLTKLRHQQTGSGRDVRFIVRPPHRTVRAAFPHTAPTSGV